MQEGELSPGRAQFSLANMLSGAETFQHAFKPRDDPGPAADLAHGAGAILQGGFELLLDPPELDRSVSAQLIALGEHFGHGERRQHLKTAHGQAHRPPPEGRQEQ